jgi:uncharacterized membrane protein
MADETRFRWNWPTAIGAFVGAIVGVLIGNLFFTVGWHRTLLVGLGAGLGAAAGGMMARRK